MPASSHEREAPEVPNHEMVRTIGRGAYGEIWLAKSETGMWRAVKIVDRRTFESEKAFQREFEGMAAFEPFSREDPGFVDILHVGRDPGDQFFYYVMELADDHLGGERVDPAEYVPKTLKTELSRRSRLLADECITIGLSLTSALAALHRQGLVHRDIKPANIIFVAGVPKIADIGLVAAHGQDSFVGTEGYVPPEGPGSVQADLYSLGKVLYELAMGKDRFDFPAVNTRLDDLPDKTSLLQLNDVLLRACANNPRDRYATAEAMHTDLLRVRDGRPLRRQWSLPWKLVAALLLVLALVGAGVTWALQQRQRGEVIIETDPPGAMVVFSGTMKTAPARFDRVKVGRQTAQVMLAGYERTEVAFTIEPNTLVRTPRLKLFRKVGSAHLESEPPGAIFELRDGAHVVQTGHTPATLSDLPTGPYQIVLKLDGREARDTIEVLRGETTHKRVEFGSGRLVVTSQPPGAKIRIDGRPVGATPLDLVLPEGAHEVVASYGKWPDILRTVQVTRGEPQPQVFEFIPGSVKITSAPGGATVFRGEVELGRTTLPISGLEPGEVTYELRLAGYKPITVTGRVEPGLQTFLPARFEQRTGPERGRPWENSLGMKFVPVGDVLMGVWPVRVKDYDAYCAARGRARVTPEFPQEPLHPVVRVSWAEANDFCEWLTRKEVEAGQLEEGQRYRLPTDLEWSLGVGLKDQPTETPEQRESHVSAFAWGPAWPPPAGCANLADTALAREGIAPIPNFTDGFAHTSPVDAYPANALGLADMTGNVLQWCHDGYRGGTQLDEWGVLRGSSWRTGSADELRLSYRYAATRRDREEVFGFRCVLVPER